VSVAILSGATFARETGQGARPRLRKWEATWGRLSRRSVIGTLRMVAVRGRFSRTLFQGISRSTTQCARQQPRAPLLTDGPGGTPGRALRRGAVGLRERRWLSAKEIAPAASLPPPRGAFMAGKKPRSTSGQSLDTSLRIP
jgi:hypothetical protein